MKKINSILSALTLAILGLGILSAGCTTAPAANQTPVSESGTYSGAWVQDTPEPAFLLTLGSGNTAIVELVVRANDKKGTAVNYAAKGSWTEKTPGVVNITYTAPVSGEPRSMEIRFTDGKGVVERLTGVNGTELMNETTPEDKRIHLVRRDPGAIKLPNGV